MDEEDEVEKIEIKVVNQVGSFDEVMVWGHGGAIDADEDVYARGIKEWIGFAEAMHVEPNEGEQKERP